MIEQLTQLVQQYGNKAIGQDSSIPAGQSEAILNETSNSIFSSLQTMASEGDLSKLAGLLKTDSLDKNTPAIKEISSSVSNSLTEKFGLNATAVSGVTSLIPKILSSLIGKANDPKDGSFNISDIINSLTGGSSAEHAGIMEAISTYGIHFGLDQNADGKVDLDDAIELTKKGGLEGMFGKLFGK